MINTDPNLELETMDALRGADNVKQRLFLEMSTGTPSISDLAYAVKVRVKEDFKIVEKVERKRRGDKPDYAVSSLRDLVGLRIVTLYRLDSLEILPLLLERIESGAREADSVFSHRGIEEVIIYSTNPTGDAQDLPGRVRALCHAFGLSDRTKVEQTPQNYTSIHIVAWCRGKYRNKYRDIPVEIQLRTAFEDVWGEIDHSLKYKRAGHAEASDRGEVSRLEMNEAHLNVMKTLIDGLAQYGDQIKLQMEGDSRIRPSSPRRSNQAVDRLDQVVNLDAGAKKLAINAVSDAHAALNQGHKDGAKRTHCRRAAGALIRAAEKLKDMKLSKEHYDEVLYVLEMERALLLFEIGNEIGGVGGNASIVEASRIYMAMIELFPDRVMPKYRLAGTLDELGDQVASRKRFEETVAGLATSELAPGHWLHSASRRLLAFSLWEDAIRRLDGAHAEEHRADALEDILKAIELAVDALSAAADDHIERTKSINNLLYFVLDFERHGGDEAVIMALGLGPAEIDGFLKELRDLAGDDAATWDTIREIEEIRENAAGIRAAAEKILTLLNDPGRRQRWSNIDGKMLRDAEASLANLPKEQPDA